jgi:glycosyltransferase involved in cell wall biosynthesis
MKLLIFTQKVNRNDPVLGFFHRWIEEFSKNVESIIVVCLEEGEHSLPKNVKVLSLGKEKGVLKLKYILNFYKYIWNLRAQYSHVFVHMNQEYILLGGILWKILGKQIYMWRNHHSGSFLTDVAAMFCKKVFCTSKFSYTAKYRKTELMPIGVDLNVFNQIPDVIRKKNSVLFLARISPVKKPHLLIEAIQRLIGLKPTLSIFGDALPTDAEYLEKMKETVKDKNLGGVVSFHSGVPNTETVKIYNEHEICVNLSSSGMYDKTIIEAMGCGCLSVSSNENLKGLIPDYFLFEEGNVDSLTSKLKYLLGLTAEERSVHSLDLREFAVTNHSLNMLVEKLMNSMK